MSSFEKVWRPVPTLRHGSFLRFAWEQMAFSSVHRFAVDWNLPEQNPRSTSRTSFHCTYLFFFVADSKELVRLGDHHLLDLVGWRHHVLLLCDTVLWHHHLECRFSFDHSLRMLPKFKIAFFFLAIVPLAFSSLSVFSKERHACSVCVDLLWSSVFVLWLFWRCFLSVHTLALIKIHCDLKWKTNLPCIQARD